MECSSCGALYNKSCGCSKGGLVDKFVRDPNKTPDSSQRPPQDCVKCGNPVEGPNCQGCALWRKKLKEVWFTICHENGIYQDLLNTYESSDGLTNVLMLLESHMESFVNDALVSLVGKVLILVIIVHRKLQLSLICNQTIDELPQTLPSFDSTCYSEKENSLPYVSKPNFVDDSPNVFNPPPQPPMYSCEFCGNDARYGHYCPHEAFQCQSLNYYEPNPCYDSNYSGYDQFDNFHPQQFLCCENCGGPHETYQCQPMNEDYYHEQNSCYDPNSFGFDQFQPPQYTVNHPIFNAQNELLNSQNKLIEQMTSIRDMVGQYMQTKEEEKRIAEEQAAKARYWKIPICYDDDDDEESSIPLKDIIISGLPPCVAITPVLSTEEPVDSLIMEDEHLDTIPETESDEFIKSSVENLVQNPSESEDASDGVCDLPICDDFPKSHLVSFSNPLFDINDDCTSSDDESFSEEDVPMENFKIFANPLFDLDEEIIATEVNLIQNEVLESITSIPPGIDSFDAESNLIESLPNQNTSIDSSSKIDSLLDEFAELLTDDSLSLPKHESFHFESDYDPSSPRPPAKPPDDDEIEPDTGLLTTKVVGDISEHYVLIPRLLGPNPLLVPDCPDCDDSRARGFVLRSLDLHILSFIWESNILILSTNVYL
ncbi:hypothetical protein Tco_1182851 [Tanacetum coccineum]